MGPMAQHPSRPIESPMSRSAEKMQIRNPFPRGLQRLVYAPSFTLNSGNVHKHPPQPQTHHTSYDNIRTTIYAHIFGEITSLKKRIKEKKRKLYRTRYLIGRRHAKPTPTNEIYLSTIGKPNVFRRIFN